MKKVITILAVMIVLVGAAFAAPAENDSARITVNAEIKCQYPAFSLQATAWGTNGNGDNASLGSAAAVAATAGTATVRIGDDVLLSNNATVTFTIYQTTLSRVKGLYTLSVNAGNLELKQVNKNGTKEDATADETEANYFAVSAAPTIDAETVAHTTMNVATAGQIKITYDGKKVGAANTNTALGSFDYTWTKNAENAAGDYEATVTLTITSIT